MPWRVLLTSPIIADNPTHTPLTFFLLRYIKKTEKIDGGGAKKKLWEGIISDCRYGDCRQIDCRFFGKWRFGDKLTVAISLNCRYIQIQTFGPPPPQKKKKKIAGPIIFDPLNHVLYPH